MSNVLITGGGGFVGGHLLETCVVDGDQVVAPSKKELDLLNAEATESAVAESEPECVYHLAALASVARSWDQPGLTIEQNTAATLNLLEAVRRHCPQARVLVAGSGEIYGIPETLPVTESAPLRPRSPYGVSKAVCELLAGFYADVHGLHVIRTRSFNHAGPGQSTTYAVASFAAQVAAGERTGDDTIEIVTGSPDTRRDFTDVRDVVVAYRALISAEPNTYNVCSGRTASVRGIIELLSECTDRELVHTVDPALVREHDVPEIRGSNERLHAATGWQPTIPLEQTVSDTLEYFRSLK